MSAQKISITAKPRNVFGKQVRSLRNDGLVPAVVYERGQESVSVTLEAVAAAKMVGAAGKNHTVTVGIDGKDRLVMVKDVDYDPRKNTIRHIAFHGIKLNEKVEAEVPITISGQAPAEKKGLMVLRTLDHVEIEALPKDLPESFEVEAEKLAEVGDQVTVSDLIVPKGVVVLSDADTVVYVVEEPRSAAAEAAAEESAQAAAETETEVAA